MPEPTSPGAGATPAAGLPATGTPAPGSATHQAAALTLEEALKRIAELEQHAANKESEAAHHGKKLTAAEKELAAYKAAEEAAKLAAMGDLEKATKLAQELEAQNQQYKAQLVLAEVRLAAKDKGIINPDLIAPTIQGQLEYDAEGKPTNLEKALDDLIKANPYLVKPAEPDVQKPPVTPSNNPGRSNIVQPGTKTPGRIPSIFDAGMWKT